MKLDLDQESENLLNQIFPVGKERWVKVLVKDRDICLKTFRMFAQPGEENPGYTIQAIGLKDEYVPQVSAIADIEDDILPILLEHLPEHAMDAVMLIFKSKKQEIKERVILEQ